MLMKALISKFSLIDISGLPIVEEEERDPEQDPLNDEEAEKAKN